MKYRKLIENIYDLIKDFEEDNIFDEDAIMLRKIKDELKYYKIKYDYFDKYGVEIKSNNIMSKESITLDETYANIYISRILGKDNCYILNSDKQPDNELLMCYSHSTGSYMFGGGSWGNDSYYDSELFDMYFEELKKYNYSYIDDLNHKLYFTLDEGFKLYKDYKDICEKYQKLFDERRKQHKIDEMKKKIEELENE